MDIVLGMTYRDRISEFKGVATGHVQYITGCNQTLLQPKVGADGAMQEARWFDDQRLQLLDHPPLPEPMEFDNGEKPGCDMPAPVR